MLQQCYNNKFNAKLLCEVVSVGLCAWTICSLFQLKRYQCSMTFHIYSHRMLPLCSIGCCIHPISFANSCGIAISPIAKKNPENCKFYLKSLHFNWEGIINSSMTKRNCIQTHTHTIRMRTNIFITFYQCNDIFFSSGTFCRDLKIVIGLRCRCM